MFSSMIPLFDVLVVIFGVGLIVFWLTDFNWFDSSFYSDDSLGCRLGGGFWSLYVHVFISGFKVYKALRFCFRVFLPCGGFGIVGNDVPAVKNRVVRFKDGSFKEYPVATKEQLDFCRLVFDGSDTRLDNFGERVITGFSVDSAHFVPPVLDVSDSFCRSHGYEVVGHGHRLNEHCDEYVKTIGCPKAENHKEHAGLVYNRKVTHHCYNYRCPDTRVCALDCYFWGAGVREAQHIDQRLLWLAEKLRKPVEVGMISVPKRLYGASEEVIRKWTILALKKRGMEGSNLICHPLRYASSKFIDGEFHMAKFYYAHHYHFCGFFNESYDTCRACDHYNAWGSKSVRGRTKYGNHGSSACLSCEHFEGLTRRLFKEDGFVMKIFDKRESFFKTAAYEISHAGFKVGAKRVHVSTWWGNCTGVKVPYARHKMVCPEPECKSDLVSLWYSGNYEIVKSSKSLDFVRNSWMPLLEDSKVVWSEVGVAYGG